MGDQQEHGDDPAWDKMEAEALYDLLVTEVIPEFYARNQNGMPERWLQRMRKSMSILTQKFSANRTVREYTESYYLPAAAKYLKRAAEKGAVGIRIVQSVHDLRNKWDGMKFGDLRTEKINDGYIFHIQVI